jgi:RimJ/RimL family protein N-acetyltransferase
MVLEGKHVRLEQLAAGHADGLLKNCSAPEIWTWLRRGPFLSANDARAFIEEALQRAGGDGEIPFATVDRKSGEVVGSTRFLDIRPEDRNCEIGWTFLSPRCWRTAINSECKLLLLTHAFETMRMARVCLKTDSRNLRSQRAIERLGAVKEGVLRRHQLAGDGVIRDSVYYSILEEEWPAVKARLQKSLARSAP